MSHLLKIFFTSTLFFLTLTACKPGVYYPFGDTNTAQNTPSTQTASTPKQTTSAPKLGELTTTDIIPG